MSAPLISGKESAMLFYRYTQNNAVRHLYHDTETGIGNEVWIEAETIADAHKQALDIGMCFSVSCDMFDCDGCENRWILPTAGVSFSQIDFKKDYRWNLKSYVHHADGEVTSHAP